jgi:hypothetical protein
MKTSLLILTSFLFAFTLSAATVTGRSAKTTLDGSEELPINDGGVDKKVSVANLLLAPQGAITVTSVNGLAVDTTTGTLDIANGKTLAASNSLTLAGTDGNTVTFPAGGGTIVNLDAAQTLQNKTLTAPTLTAPTLGVATATSVNKLTITAPSSSATLTIADGKTLTASNTLTLAGTDGTTMTFPSGSGTVVTADSTVTLTNKTLTSPTFTTPTLGVASATSINKVAITAPATNATLTIAEGKTLTANHSLTLAGTDSTTMTFPGTSQTLVGLTATQTLTNKTLTAPVMTTPTLGVATATSVNKVAITAPASSATLTIADGKTLTASNTLTLAGTDSTTFTFPATTATVFTSTLASNDVAAANSIWGASNALVFEGASANDFEVSIVPADVTADVTYLLPDAAAGSYAVMSSALATNAPNIANSVTGASNALVFEGATADNFETSIVATDPTADRTVTVPNATGTVALSQASTAVALAGDNQAVTPGAASVIQLSSDDATATNRTFTLSATDAITGQIYVIIAPAANACEIADTGIQVLSAAWSPNASDTLTLLFNGTNFIELARSAN